MRSLDQRLAIGAFRDGEFQKSFGVTGGNCRVRHLWPAPCNLRSRSWYVASCSLVSPTDSLLVLTVAEKGEPMRKLTLLIFLFAAATVALPQEMKMPAPKTSGPQSDAQKAFDKLKTMAGT